jgi:hypothetical protein
MSKENEQIGKGLGLTSLRFKRPSWSLIVFLAAMLLLVSSRAFALAEADW